MLDGILNQNKNHNCKSRKPKFVLLLLLLSNDYYCNCVNIPAFELLEKCPDVAEFIEPEEVCITKN